METWIWIIVCVWLPTIAWVMGTRLVDHQWRKVLREINQRLAEATRDKDSGRSETRYVSVSDSRYCQSCGQQLPVTTVSDSEAAKDG